MAARPWSTPAGELGTVRNRLPRPPSPARVSRVDAAHVGRHNPAFCIGESSQATKRHARERTVHDWLDPTAVGGVVVVHGAGSPVRGDDLRTALATKTRGEEPDETWLDPDGADTCESDVAGPGVAGWLAHRLPHYSEPGTSGWVPADRHQLAEPPDVRRWVSRRDVRQHVGLQRRGGAARVCLAVSGWATT